MRLELPNFEVFYIHNADVDARRIGPVKIGFGVVIHLTHSNFLWLKLEQGEGVSRFWHGLYFRPIATGREASFERSALPEQRNGNVAHGHLQAGRGRFDVDRFGVR